jgi:hypothetical protein
MNNRDAEGKKGDWRARIRRTVQRLRYRIKRRVPYGLRTVLGLLLVIGGIFGFLPVLGFWMIPLGIAVIWIDVSATKKWLRRRRR